MEKTFSCHSTTISYTLQGKGTPVVLLHGFGEDSQIWNTQVSFLQEFCMLLVPDLPGSGKSSLFAKENSIADPVSIEDYADLIYALLQTENIASCIMLGHSMGGYITLAFAEKYPAMLRAFGLVHSTAFADSEEKKAMRAKAVTTIAQYGAAAFLRNTIPNLFGKAFKETSPEKVSQLIASAAGFTVAALQQYYIAMMNRPNRCNVLAGNPLPVLFVMGTEDVAAPMEDVLQQVHLPRISYIHVLPGCGHMGMWEAPAPLNQLLLAFINP
ncbi:MAG TPA: alpha/beta hydrolase [Sediminibacterium sp.]